MILTIDTNKPITSADLAILRTILDSHAPARGEPAPELPEGIITHVPGTPPPASHGALDQNVHPFRARLASAIADNPRIGAPRDSKRPVSQQGGVTTRPVTETDHAGIVERVAEALDLPPDAVQGNDSAHWTRWNEERTRHLDEGVRTLEPPTPQPSD